MEIKTTLPINKCTGPGIASHEGKVFGLCKKCGEHVCTVCSCTKHYDHLHSFFAYDMECAYLANFVTKLKGTTQKALKTRNKLLPFLEFGPQVAGLKNDTEKSYGGLSELVCGHREEMVATLSQANVVKILKNQLDSLTKGRIRQMEDLREKLAECKGQLMSATLSGRYYESLPILKETERYQSELAALIEAQQKETDGFYEQLRRFKDIFVGIDVKPLEEVCKITNIDKLDAKLYKICREAGILAAFSVTTKRLTEIYFSDYSPPYNCAVLEILGNAYIIGGCVTDSAPGTEESYLDKTVTVDLDSGVLLAKDSMKDKRMCFGSAVWDHQVVYVVGGYNHTRSISGCEKFDTKKSVWSSIPSLPKGRSNTGVCAFVDSLYCFGGYSADDEEEKSIERLPLTEGNFQWETVAIKEGSKWSSRQNPGAIPIADKTILVFGGKSEGKTLKQSFVFDTEKGTFEETDEMKHPDTMLGCKPVVFVGKVYAFGCHENYLHVYDIGKGVWEGLPAIRGR